MAGTTLDNMTLILNNQPLKALMRDFYILTGIKIVIFDSGYQEILSYPESHCHFCALMHNNADSRKKCMESNEQSFQKCRKTSRLEIYHCHAGLVEATAPLVDNGAVIGYIMFGQISDLENQEKTKEHLDHMLREYGLQAPDPSPAFYQMTLKNREQILAAAKILEACTFYVLLKDMISLRRQNFMKNMNTFLLEHLSEDLSVERLMQEFHISRNKLYDTAGAYLGTGIAEHIKNLRLNEARRLLSETDLPVHQIADRVGFADYNYFCRVFKKEVGMPARQYRRQKKV